ncbi:T9SS type B sorting domain-containing protein [Chryseobacterium sp. FH1]|uniref:DUF7948 domain-containing protein n=1 Tax=Chryseobacterium sp. FH1 TaxID=1233951 RepID=UPI0004E438CB|nr:T9SS type B sorting domain-containing protein [Chryseobacterium sp. FH1]KFC20493.1 hypothetical protein IO90_15180 [Chryseobacterium sp. FH1]
MKKFYSLVLFLVFTFFFAQKKNQDFSFYENKGQIVDQDGKSNPDVKYLLNSPGLNVQIKKNGFSYDVYETERKDLKKQKSVPSEPVGKMEVSDLSIKYKYHRVNIDFLDSNENIQIKAEGKSEDYENYYNLQHKKEGVSFVHRYRKITYKNLYHNIDLVFFKPDDSTKPVEYNFLVHPGGKISDIKMKFKGAKTKLKDGKLSMNLRFGEMQENIPNSWIENDRKQSIDVNYKDLGNQTFGFDSSINNSDRTIVIDPVPTRIWGSYYGGSGDETTASMMADDQNNLYATGSTNSVNNIATSGSYQVTLNGNTDGFIFAIDDDGNRLWSSYYGSTYTDNFGKSVVFNNKIYIIGYSAVSAGTQTYPNANFSYTPFQGILVSFNFNGTFVDEKKFTSTYNYTGISTLTVDDKNNCLYLIGQTHPTGFVAQNQIGSYSPGYIDLATFIIKLKTDNSTEWTKLINREYVVNSSYVSPDDKLCLIGWAFSNLYLTITPDAVQKTKNYNYVGYYGEFDSKGTQLYGTYLGGFASSEEVSFARRIGNTIIYSGFNASLPPYGKFIRKVDTTTGQLIFSKYYANISSLSDTASYIDEKGNTYLWGHADTRGFFPTPNAYNSSYGNIYLMKVDSESNTVWATYYGGYDYPHMYKGKNGSVYFSGRANSSSFDIATSGAFQNYFAGGYADGFLAKFHDCTENQILSSEMKVCLGSELKLSVISGTSYNWTGPNGFSSTIQNPSIPKISLSDAGIYSCTVTGTGACDGTFTIDVKIEDKPAPTGNPVQSICSAKNPTLKDIEVIGADIKWYDNLGNNLPITTTLEDGKTYYASQTIDNCESSNRLAVQVNILINNLSANDFSDSFCNDTTADFKTINIDDYKKELISNPQDYAFEIRNSKGELETGDTNLNVGPNIFDVKIISSLGCFQYVKLNLTLDEKPKANLPAEEEFCDNVGTPLKVDFVSGYSYQWNTGETSNSIIADIEQTYTVTVTTPAGCVNTASTIVKKAKLAEIQNIVITNNSVMIVMSVAGEYLYSLDKNDWKTSNKFENLENGTYTVFVKTKLGCDLGSKSFTIFSLSNIFSPNGDGINDTWKISGIENYPNSEIKIFDRQGKMVLNQVTKGETFEWNGESNGRKLPTDSYWYQIKISDGRILEGYVVIKHRN